MVKAKLSLCFIKHHALSSYWGNGRALDAKKWSDSRPGRFKPEEEPPVPITMESILLSYNVTFRKPINNILKRVSLAHYYRFC